MNFHNRTDQYERFKCSICSKKIISQDIFVNNILAREVIWGKATLLMMLQTLLAYKSSNILEGR